MRQRSRKLILKIKGRQALLRSLQAKVLTSTETFESKSSSIWWALVVALALLILLITAQNSSADRLSSGAYAKKACEAMRKTRDDIKVKAPPGTAPVFTDGNGSVASTSKIAMSCSNTLENCLVVNPSGYNDSVLWEASNLNYPSTMTNAEREKSLGWCDKAERLLDERIKSCESFLTAKIETYGADRGNSGDLNSNNYAPRCFMKSWEGKLLEAVPGGGFIQGLNKWVDRAVNFVTPTPHSPPDKSHPSAR